MHTCQIRRLALPLLVCFLDPPGHSGCLDYGRVLNVHPGHTPGASSDRKGANQGKKQKYPDRGKHMAFVLIEFLRMRDAKDIRELQDGEEGSEDCLRGGLWEIWGGGGGGRKLLDDGR